MAKTRNFVYLVPEDQRHPGCPPVAGYARLSRNPDGTLVSVADQIAAMLRDAAAKGLDLVVIYFDDDLSAWTSGKFRPGWDAYLSALDTGKYAGAMSYHHDRLARNGPDGEAFLSVMTRHELPLYTPGQTLDLGSNGDARMVSRMLFAVAINQSDSTSRRARDHKDEARRRGDLRYVMGSQPPVGWQDTPAGWVPEPVASAMLREVAAAMLADPEHNLSAAYADQPPCYTSPKGQAEPKLITEQMTRTTLQRPYTAGLMTDREGKVMGQVKIAGQVITDPPVDEATWRELQVIFGTRKRGPVVDADKYPHGPLLRCGKCGNQLSGELTYDRRRGVVVKETPSYRCSNPHKRLGVVKPCRGVSIPVDQVDRVLRAAVEGWAATSPAWAAASSQQVDLSGQQAALMGERTRKLALLGDLTVKRAMGVPADALDLADAQLTHDIALINAELDTLAAAAANPLPVAVDWPSMTATEQRRMVAEAFQTPIMVTPGNGGGAARTADERMIMTLRG